MKKVAFITLGCKVNQYDTQAMQKAFTDHGFGIAREGEPADAVIVNTCTVTGEADRKSRQMIRRAAKLNPKAVIVAAGCFAQGDPEAAKGINGVDIVSGIGDRAGLVVAVEAAVSSRSSDTAQDLVGDVCSLSSYEEMGAEGTEGMSRAYLKIEDGCDAYCSYCFVPYVRGHVRSRSIEQIEKEAALLADAGYSEIILTGIHLGCYGREFGAKPGLIDAIKAACRPEGIRRVRMSSLEPTELTDGIILLFKEEPKLARHLHLPLQSGDDSILRAMNRHYDSGYFEDTVNRARSGIGPIGLTTDIIVGFPGETEEMFANSVSLIKRIGFEHVHVFPYSKRKGTPAASMPNQLPEKTKRDRVSRLIRVASGIAGERNLLMLGRVLDVVLETRVEDMGGGYTYVGYSSEYVRVRFSSTSNLTGMAAVMITSSNDEGVAGVLVE